MKGKSTFLKNKSLMIVLVLVFAFGMLLLCKGSTSHENTNNEYGMKEMNRPLRYKDTQTKKVRTFPEACEAYEPVETVSCYAYWLDEIQELCKKNGSAGKKCLIYLDKKAKANCENKKTNYEKELCKCTLDSVYQAFGEDVYKLFVFFSIKGGVDLNSILNTQTQEKKKIFRRLSEDSCRFPISDQGEMYGPGGYYLK